MAQIAKTWLELFRALPLAAQVLLGGGLVNAVGVGVALPIGMLFVHDVLAVPLSLASLLVPITAFGAMVGHYLVGNLSDRKGPIWGCVVPTAVSLIGALLYATAQSFAVVTAGALITGLGIGASTGWFALLSTLVPTTQRSFAYGVNQVASNIGIGLGLVLSGLASAAGGENAYRFLFTGKALAHLMLIILLLKLSQKVVIMSISDGAGEPSRAHRTRREVVVALILVCSLNFIMIAAGVAQLDSAVVAGILSREDFPSWMIASIMLLNTIVVVILNLLLSARIARVAPAYLFAMTGPLWAVSWTLCAVALHLQPAFGVSLFFVALSVFALGEVMTAIALPSLTSRLAKVDTVGRGFAIQNITTSAAFLVGPLVTSSILAIGAASTSFIVFGGVVLLMAPLALYLNRQLGSVE